MTVIRTDTLTAGAATVTVTLETAVMRDGVEAPIFFHVESSTGYTARLTACPCNEPGFMARTPCAKGWDHPFSGKAKERSEHFRTHCHAWHWERVRALADAVLASYKPKSHRPTVGGLVRGRLGDEAFVPLRREMAGCAA